MSSSYDDPETTDKTFGKIACLLDLSFLEKSWCHIGFFVVRPLPSFSQFGPAVSQVKCVSKSPNIK